MRVKAFPSRQLRETRSSLGLVLILSVEQSLVESAALEMASTMPLDPQLEHEASKEAMIGSMVPVAQSLARW